jgi:hypothetical protein
MWTCCLVALEERHDSQIRPCVFRISRVGYCSFRRSERAPSALTHDACSRGLDRSMRPLHLQTCQAGRVFGGASRADFVNG